MEVVGIDLSKWGSAITVINENYKLKSFKAFTSVKKTSCLKNTIYLDKKLTDQQVIAKVIDFICDYKITQQYNYFALEAQSFGSKGDYWQDMYGIIRYELYKNDKKLIMIPPMSLKKFATGAGNADKSIVAINALKKYDLDFSEYNECSNNIVDSFYCALIGKTYFEKKENNATIRLLNHQKEVIEKLLNAKI